MGTGKTLHFNASTDGKKVVNNEIYTIFDIELKVPRKKNVSYTYSKTVLNPDQQTRGHRHKDADEIYKFLKVDCRAVMMVGRETFLVREDSLIYVPKGRFHRVINPSRSVVIFETISPGAVARPHIRV